MPNAKTFEFKRLLSAVFARLRETNMSKYSRRASSRDCYYDRPAIETLERRLLLTAEAEPNNSAAAATAFVPNDSIEGAVSAVNDIDYFKISLTQGSRLRLHEVNYSYNYVLQGLPLSIEVLDSAGSVLAASSDGDDLQMTANQTGVYLVRITSRSAFGDIADSYTIKTSVVSFAGVSEAESNNTRASANALNLNQAFRGQLSSSDVSDFYSFNLNANDSLFVNFNGHPEQRPGVRLLNSTGAVLDNGLAGQGLAYNAASSGTYYLEVVDNSAAGQTEFYVGVIQVSVQADMPSDLGEDLDQSSPWALGRENSVVRGELSSLSDVDTFAITVNSLARAEITLYVAGSESIPTYGRSMIAYDRQGAMVAKSQDGVLNIERYLGSTPGEYLIQIAADSSTGLGTYGLRAWNFDDFSNQRDVPLHLVDYARQFPVYNGFNFTAPFGAPEAIPFVTGLLQSRFGAYDIDVTLNKPDIPLDRYIRSGFGDFQDLTGGAGGGYYGVRRPNGSSANNSDDTSWPLQYGSGSLIHEFGHAAGLDHAREVSSVMAYYHTDNVFSPGARFGFVNVDQRRPDQLLTNDRNRLDWNLSSGSQVPERESDLNSPQEIDSNFREMTLELNESTTSLATQQTPSHLASGDFNGDGWKDIVVTHSGTTLSVYMSDAQGGFLAPRNYTVNSMAWWNEAATVADFNRDGRDDVAVISRDQETLTVLIAGTDGSLVARPNQSIGRWPVAIQSVDMNGDGIVDLVAANDSSQVSIMRGIGDGTFSPSQSFSSGQFPNHLVLRDFNGDNRVDIATSNYGSDTISIMLADSAGGYNTVGTFSAGSVARGLVGGDFDGDGDVDLASANFHIRKLTIYNNRGNGLFDVGNTFDLGVYTENLTTADMNQDGKVDIIASGNSWSIEVLLGMGNGTFSRGVSYSTPSGSVNSIALDVNRDGRLDIASISFWQNQLFVQTAKANSLRNDRVVAYGEITSAQDVDVYSMRVSAGAEYSFDIDSAEFQYPLDAELKVLSSTGAVIASNRQAIDRESGIDSVDPYIVTTFSTSETIRIVVSSERGTAGAYRLKVTPTTALKNDGPRVLAVVPDNKVVVDSTRQISFLMDKPIDPTSVRSDSVIVRGAQNGIQSGSAFYDPLDGFLIWTADSTLPIDTYTVTLASGASGIRDMFGNELDGEIPVDFKFPKVSGNGTSGGNFVTSFTVNRVDTAPPTLFYAAYQRDPSNRGRFEFRWNDELSFRSIEEAQFTLRGAGPDGQFNTADDRIQSMDAVYDKIANLGFGQGSVDVYSRGYPDSDLYRIESLLTDVAGNAVQISEQINVGSTVPESALFVDAGRTQNGLTGSYVNRSLRSTTSVADWRTTQSISGTRVDSQIAFNRDSLGRRADVNVTGGTDDNWDEFSAQWDGWITIPRDGLRLQTRSDDGSRLLIDTNKNGQFDTSELFDNNWGRGQGITDGALTPGLSAGTYQIRMQYEEGNGGNRMLLEWIDSDSASIEKGSVNGPSVIGMSIQPGSVYVGVGAKKLEVDFSGSLDTSSLTSNNFRLRYSVDADFYNGNDIFVQDADGVIQWDPTLHRATFESSAALKAGFYLVELNGRTGGIRNTVGKLLDGEFLSNFIDGNSNILSPSRHVSGNGIPGGNFAAAFSIQSAIGITILSPSISENGGTTTGTVTRDTPTASALIVSLVSSDTTAATVPSTVTIPAGATSAPFTVTAVNDANVDGSQVTTISAAANGFVTGTAQLTVVDDDPPPTVTLSSNIGTIAEATGTAIFTVTLSTTSYLPIAIDLGFTGTATLANDYTRTGTTIVIAAGQTVGSVTLTAVQDAVDEADETVIAEITNITNGTELTPQQATVRIADDDTRGVIISLASGNTSESGGKATFTVVLTSQPTSEVIISLSSSDITEGTVSPAALIFTTANWSNVRTVTITGVDDNIEDGDVDFRIETGLASGGDYGGISIANVNVKNIDNDFPDIIVSVVPGIRPAFSWNAISSFSQFEIWVSRKPGTAAFHQATVTGTAYTAPIDFGIGTYAVRIRAINSFAASPWTTEKIFVINTAATFEPLAANQVTTRPTISWEPLSGAVRYEVLIGDLTTGNSQFVRNLTLAGTSWRVTTDFTPGSYRATIRGIDSAGLAALWSVPLDFFVTRSIAPVLGTLGAPVTFTENGSPVLIASKATVSDSDSAAFRGGRLTVTVSRNVSSFDRITIVPFGSASGQIDLSGSNVRYGGVVIGTFAGKTAFTVTLNDKATALAVQALLRRIAFSNLSENPTVLDRTVTVTLSDGAGGISIANTKVVKVVSVNDSPVVGAFDRSVTYTESGSPIILDSNATVTDPDSINFASGRLTVALTANRQSTDWLGIRHVGSGIGQIGVSGNRVSFGGVGFGTFSGTTTLLVRLSTKATPAAVQALLRSITFSSVSDNPSPLNRTVRVTLTDGDGGTSIAVSKTVRVIAVNDPPLTLSLSNVSMLENKPVGTTVGTFTATDLDSVAPFTYSLVTGTGSTDNARFEVSGATLKIRVVFDYEAKKSYSIRMRVKDSGGAFLDKVFTISVLNQLDGTSEVDAFVLSYTSTTVAVSMSINGGALISQGAFPLTRPLTLLNLSSEDSVRVNGTNGNDMLSLSGAGLFINNHRLIVNGPAKLALSGGAGSDTYRFDADNALGLITLAETSAGIDTIDLSSTAASVSLNLAIGTAQVVNANLSVTLGSGLAFENLIGGSGNDSLTGNSLANTLIGNAGGDTLNGLGGRDILIGGIGLDTLKGGDDEDILIAGRTTSDALFRNLNRIQIEWTSDKSYTTRIRNLRAGVGSPVVSLKARVNVLNDAGEDDSLIGGNNSDWYFRALDDVIIGKVVGEVLDAL